MCISFMRRMPLLALECEFLGINLLSRKANRIRVVFGIIYWYIWTVLLPRWGDYCLEEEKDVLEDGTNITKLVRSYRIA
jgi:hypothetical protein